MAVRSRPFWVASVGAGQAVAVYTVPPDRTAICRTWTLTNFAAVAGIIGARVDRNGAILHHWRGTVGGNSTVAVPVPVILDEGDRFIVNNETAAAIETVGYGSLLLGDPA